MPPHGLPAPCPAAARCRSGGTPQAAPVYISLLWATRKFLLAGPAYTANPFASLGSSVFPHCGKGGKERGLRPVPALFRSAEAFGYLLAAKGTKHPLCRQGRLFSCFSQKYGTFAPPLRVLLFRKKYETFVPAGAVFLCTFSRESTQRGRARTRLGERSLPAR